MYPLKFEPLLKSIVWGGEKIVPYKSIVSTARNVGESWELSAVQGNESVVANGEFAGKNIVELIHEYKGDLLGEKIYAQSGNTFPILVKFIDARDDLSIQVHPDDELAAARHNDSKGKTEMWYVVKADEGAHLMSGMSQKITPEEYVSRIENNTITDVLCDYNVKEGDVFFLPAGRVHSIGRGCFIAEIQQTSDITYRIYDFGRLGLDGKPRELHVEQSKDAVDYSIQDDYKTSYTPELNKAVSLVECEYFKTHLLDLTESLEVPVKANDSFMIVICLEGQGKLNDSNGYSLDLKQGETVLVPACVESITLDPSEKLKVMTCFI